MNAPQNIPSPSIPPPMAVPPAPPMAQGGMPPQAPPPMNPNYAEGGEMGGGSKSNPIKDFFSDINIVEAGILALGVATFLYAIHYYKFEMQLSKTGYADLNGRMQKLESDIKKTKQAEANANAQGGGRAKVRKRIMF